MHKITTTLAIAVLTSALACDRPAGEDSAADQQETQPDYPQAAPTSEQQQQAQQQQQQARPGEPTTAMPQTGDERRAGELRVADITRNPDARVGQDVTVVGEVEDMLAKRSFKLNDEAPTAAGADDDIVVLGKQDAQWTMEKVKDDARVRVSGKLMRVPAANLERDLGWKLDDKVKSAVQSEQVVLIAQRVEPLEGGEREPVRGTQQGEDRGMQQGEDRGMQQGEDRDMQ